jgi:hypothetical protein
MHPLFRNPLLQLLRRLWWLPVTALALAWGGGAQYAGVVSQMIFALLAFVAGLILAARGHGAYLSRREKIRHHRARHRFLCPRCLSLGGFRFACGACGNEVESFTVLTGGAYASDCPSCHVRLFAKNKSQVAAHCENCLGSCDRSLHHERRVRVIATLLDEDFRLICRLTGAPPLRAADHQTFACMDDGECLRYILSFDSEAGVETADLPMHALRNVETIWLDAAGADPLRLGRIIDAFIRQSGLTEAQRRRITVFIRQPAPEAAIRNKLAALFGLLRCGFGPSTLFDLKKSANDVNELSDKGTASEITSGSSLPAPEPVEQPRA